jgi:hypothetical protein
MSTDQRATQVSLGDAVYDESGEQVGVVRGFDSHGFYVSAEDDVDILTDERSGGAATDALMWRCWECGEMGQLGEIPEECPSCGAPREEIYYWQED